MAKKKPIDMGKPGYDSKDWEAFHWCIENNIAIAAYAKSTTEWYVDISNKGKISRDPNAYGKTEIWEKIFEYCKYYYDKHRR